MDIGENHSVVKRPRMDSILALLFSLCDLRKLNLVPYLENGDDSTYPKGQLKVKKTHKSRSESEAFSIVQNKYFQLLFSH